MLLRTTACIRTQTHVRALVRAHLHMLTRTRARAHTCMCTCVNAQDAESNDCTMDPVKNKPILPENSVACDIKVKVKQVRATMLI